MTNFWLRCVHLVYVYRLLPLQPNLKPTSLQKNVPIVKNLIYVLLGNGCRMSEVALGSWNYVSSHLNVACNSFLSVNCHHIFFVIPNTLMYWSHRGTGLRISSRLKYGCCTQPFTNSRFHFLAVSALYTMCRFIVRNAFQVVSKWSEMVKSRFTARQEPDGVFKFVSKWNKCLEIMQRNNDTSRNKWMTWSIVLTWSLNFCDQGNLLICK